MNPFQAKRAERQYLSALHKIAKQVGQLINGFPAGTDIHTLLIENMLRRYAEAIAPWATITAQKMIDEVNHKDLLTWREMTKEMSLGLRQEIHSAPVGEVMKRILSEQVTLIQSIPLDAAQRVHDLTIKGIEEGTRSKSLIAEIMRSGEVSRNRATLIARTETARTSSALTQARALHVGATSYVWQTSKDGRVRPSHKAMQGKVVEWLKPPTLDGMTANAGCLPNCRCFAKLILPE